MFLNPLMLVGVAAAAVPLVLHLLSRARFHDVEWGAMLFLESAEPARRNSERLTQFILMLVRMALLALVAVALARPVVRAGWAGADPAGQVTAALLLDCSASMQFDENGRSRFEMAQAAAKQVLRGLRPGDHVSLFLMSRRQAAAELEPTGDFRSVAARIDEQKPTLGPADLRESLRTAADVLARFPTTGRDVYVVCDRQALSWSRVDDRFSAEWRARAGGPPRLFVVPVGGQDSDNISVERVALVDPPAIRGQKPAVDVRLHNFGLMQRTAMPLTLTLDGQVAAEKKVNLSPGEVQTVRLAFKASTAGSHVLETRVSSTGYTADDRLAAAVEVIDPIKVLVISGNPRPGRLQSEADFLRWALSPYQAANKDGADPCAVTVIGAEQWTPGVLDAYQVVIVANVERPTPAQARGLERFVYGGGCLLVAPGSLSRVEDYNAMLYKDGAGILPAYLRDPTDEDGSDTTTLGSFENSHPIFQFARSRADGLSSAVITRYFPADVRQLSAETLASYSAGPPFLIEGRSERGRVLLMTTSLDAEWTALPLSSFYLPFVQSAVRYLASGIAHNRNLSPGRTMVLEFARRVPERRVRLSRPDGLQVNIPVVAGADKSRVRYADTTDPGIYTFRVDEPGKPGAAVHFVVQAPREESNLAPISADQWSWLEREMRVRRIDEIDRPIPVVMAAGREARELWGWALAAALLMGLIEMAIARRWSAAGPITSTALSAGTSTALSAGTSTALSAGTSTALSAGPAAAPAGRPS